MQHLDLPAERSHKSSQATLGQRDPVQVPTAGTGDLRTDTRFSGPVRPNLEMRSVLFRQHGIGLGRRP